MSTKELREARVKTEYIPAHKYIGIWEPRAEGYGDFWSYHDCDRVCGAIESMRDSAHPVVTPHTAGWVRTNGKREYFYGYRRVAGGQHGVAGRFNHGHVIYTETEGKSEPQPPDVYIHAGRGVDLVGSEANRPVLNRRDIEKHRDEYDQYHRHQYNPKNYFANPACQNVRIYLISVNE